jgi:PKD domain
MNPRRRLGLRGGLVGAAAVAVMLASGAGAAAASPKRVFNVGAAVENIDPPYPVYMGGYGGGPAGGTITRHIDPLTGKAEHFTVRAIAIGAAGHVVEFASVDTQGYFAGYQEGPYGISNARNAVAAWLRSHGVPGAHSSDIVISSEHEHASPTLLGIWGPPAHQLPYLKQVYASLVSVLERAYRQARPATITWGSADVPWVSARVIAEGNAFEGWPRDGSLGVLWARDARTGATIATYVTTPGYANIVYGPGDLLGADGKAGAVLSSDFPNYADAYLERRLGGIAIAVVGTLGNQTSALQTDNSPSPDLGPEPGEPSFRQTRAFDDIIHMGQLFGNITLGALARGRSAGTPRVASAEQYIQTPVYNPILLSDDRVAQITGSPFWTAVTLGQLYPTDRSFSPPYGNGSSVLSTWVTGVRIGDLLFTTMPGEFFPSTHETWLRSISGPAGNFVIGAAQDFLGYEYPVYAYPFTLEGSDEGIFNPSLTLGDQVVTAGEQDAQALGYTATFTTSPEYTATENDYLRQFQPGVQFLPFPYTGDLGASGRHRGFVDVFEGLSEPPRDASSQGACLADTLTACPTPPPAMGAFQWNFGDGKTASTPPQTYARAYFSPFVAHDFCSAGTYSVSVLAQDSSGQTDGMTLPIRIYPALVVRVLRVSGGRRLRVAVRGGGGVVYVHWRVGSRNLYGTSITAPGGSLRDVRVTVLDGTGNMVSARPNVVSARSPHTRPPSREGAVDARGRDGTCRVVH